MWRLITQVRAIFLIVFDGAFFDVVITFGILVDLNFIDRKLLGQFLFCRDRCLHIVFFAN